MVTLTWSVKATGGSTGLQGASGISRNNLRFPVVLYHEHPTEVQQWDSKAPRSYPNIVWPPENTRAPSTAQLVCH